MKELKVSKAKGRIRKEQLNNVTRDFVMYTVQNIPEGRLYE
jgi:hypothetical protein